MRGCDERAGGSDLRRPRLLAVLRCRSVHFLALTQLPLVVHRGETFERRCFWGGTFGAAVSVFIAGLPAWRGSSIFACVGVFVMWLPAYFGNGEQIKIRGKVYSFHIKRPSTTPEPAKSSTPGLGGPPGDHPDAYGTNVTAAKFWLLLIVAMVFSVGGAVIGWTDLDEHLLLVTCVGLLVVTAMALGYFIDGSYGYPIARRQYVQFVVISAI